MTEFITRAEALSFQKRVTSSVGKLVRNNQTLMKKMDNIISSKKHYLNHRVIQRSKKSKQYYTKQILSFNMFRGHIYKLLGGKSDTWVQISPRATKSKESTRLIRLTVAEFQSLMRLIGKESGTWRWKSLQSKGGQLGEELNTGISQ